MLSLEQFKERIAFHTKKLKSHKVIEEPIKDFGPLNEEMSKKSSKIKSGWRKINRTGVDYY